MPTNPQVHSSLELRPQITCPHCWHVFPPEDVLWVAAHPDLIGDSLLPTEPQRFLPSRFNVHGMAIDVKGAPCEKLACPHCHLTIPRACLEMESLFVSIIGAPSSGKSYYLASMIWRLENSLLKNFSLAFGTADPAANQVLNRYIETLFHNPHEDEPVTLPKTEKEGDLYESVNHGDRVVWYPRPFVFQVRPDTGHPAYQPRSQLSRTICLYDNAGEHFLPGGDSPMHPCKHLALSRVLLFLFDPTQHLKLRKICSGVSNDPQLRQGQQVYQQHQVLLEAANRIRNHHVPRLAANEKYDRPLVVVVTKFDAWGPLIKRKRLQDNLAMRPVKPGLSALDLTHLKEVSDEVRELMCEHAREVVQAAEGFFKEVIYIPVSALGRSPEVSKAGEVGQLVVRPRDIDPMWAEVPMLYATHLSTPRLIPVGRRTEPANYAWPPGQGGKGAAVPNQQGTSPRLKETGS